MVPKFQLLHLPNDTHWADPQEQLALDVEYKLRHCPHQLTTSDMMVAATLINCYRELTQRSGKEAAYIVAAMRKVRKDNSHE